MNHFSLLTLRYCRRPGRRLVGILPLLLIAVCLYLTAPVSGKGKKKAKGNGTEFPLFLDFAPLKGVFEPSAVEQLPDGRFFVVEDESANALAVLTLQQNGEFLVSRLDLASLDPGSGTIDDFEGIAVHEEGYVYAITSHSRETDGLAYPQREKLVRFKIEGDTIIEPQVFGDLKKSIADVHPLLQQSAEIADVKNQGGFNIEGITFDESGERLLIGFRSPVSEGRAIIAEIENIQDVFEQGEEPEVEEDLVLLDLKGFGIRGMVYDPKLDGFLIISGPGNRDRTLPFGLWFWNGDADSDVQQVSITCPDGAVNRAEGITPVRWQDREMVLVMRDDGNSKKKRGGHYILLSYDQVIIWPNGQEEETEAEQPAAEGQPIDHQ